MTTHAIRDGYYEDGFIAELPQMHPALRFRYRPMLPEERDTIESQRGIKTPAQYHAILTAAMAKRIESWDASAAAGTVMPVAPESVRTLRPRLFDRLYGIISGDLPSDPDPKASPDQRNAEAELALQAAIDGVPVASAKQEADRKNS